MIQQLRELKKGGQFMVKTVGNKEIQGTFLEFNGFFCKVKLIDNSAERLLSWMEITPIKIKN